MKYISFSPKLLYILLLFFTFLLHLTYINNGFTWLDHRDLVEKRAVVPTKDLPNIFTTRYGDTGFYRPLVTFVNSLDAIMYGDYAPGYHLTNIVLFLAITAVLPLVISRFFSLPFSEALAATTLFAVHPFTVLPVGAISYRPELLFTFFLMLTMYFYIKYRKTRSPILFIATAACFLAALFSKETAFVLGPAVFGLWEYSEMKKFSKKHFMKLKNFLLPGSICLILGIYVALRIRAVPEGWHTTIHFHSLSTAVGTRMAVIGKLLLGFSSPFVPNISDAIAIVPATHPAVISTVAILLFLLVIQVRVGIRSTGGKALFLFFTSISPALNILPLPRMYSPHYGFIALIPFSICAVLVFKEALKIKGKGLVVVIGIVWLTTASINVFISGQRFKNDETLFTTEVAADANFHEGQFYLGNYYLQREEYKKAEQFYKAALTLDSSIHAYVEPGSILTNLAAVSYHEHNWSQSEYYLRQAEKFVTPTELTHIRYDRAVLASQKKDYSSVIILLNRPDFSTNPYALLLLADAYHNSGQSAKAVAILRQSLPYWPEDKKVKIEQLIQGTQAELEP